MREFWEKLKRVLKRTYRNWPTWWKADVKNRVITVLFAACLILLALVVFAQERLELADGEWLITEGDFKYFSRVWDDGSRYTMDIYVQPETDAMLMRTTWEWWIGGDRRNTVQVVQIAAPMPPRVVYWLEKRAGKHLDRLEEEGVWVRP